MTSTGCVYDWPRHHHQQPQPRLTTPTAPVTRTRQQWRLERTAVSVDECSVHSRSRRARHVRRVPLNHCHCAYTSVCLSYCADLRRWNRRRDQLLFYGTGTPKAPFTRYNLLSTGCIVYTNIQPVVKPVWQPVWQTAVSCIQPVVKPVVQPGLTTGCIV